MPDASPHPPADATSARLAVPPARPHRPHARRLPGAPPPRRRRHGAGLPRPAAVAQARGGAQAAPHRPGRQPTALQRFQAEAEAVAKLNHPNIVHIHHLGESDGLRVHGPRVRRGAQPPRPPRPQGAARPCRSRSASSGRWCSRSRRPTSRGSSTATSSRRTSWSRRKVEVKVDRLRPVAVLRRRGPAPQPDPERRHARHAALHVAGAGAGQAGRSPQRHLLARRHVLPPAHRRAAVPRDDRVRRGAEARPGAAAAAGRAAPGPARRPVRHGPQDDGEEPGGPVPVGTRNPPRPGEGSRRGLGRAGRGNGTVSQSQPVALALSITSTNGVAASLRAPLPPHRPRWGTVAGRRACGGGGAGGRSAGLRGPEPAARRRARPGADDRAAGRPLAGETGHGPRARIDRAPRQARRCAAAPWWTIRSSSACSTSGRGGSTRPMRGSRGWRRSSSGPEPTLPDAKGRPHRSARARDHHCVSRKPERRAAVQRTRS